MSQTNLDRLGGSLPTDLILPDAGRARPRSADSGTFGGYLWQLHSKQTNQAGATDLTDAKDSSAALPEPARAPVEQPRSSDDRPREEPRETDDVAHSESATGRASEADERQPAETREEPEESERPTDTVEDESPASAEKPTEPERDEDSAEGEEAVNVVERPVDVLENLEDAKTKQSSEGDAEVKVQRPDAKGEAETVGPDPKAVKLQAREDAPTEETKAKQSEDQGKSVAQDAKQTTEVVAATTVAEAEAVSAEVVVDDSDAQVSDSRQARQNQPTATDATEVRAEGEGPSDAANQQQTSTTKQGESGVPLPPEVVDQSGDRGDEPPKHHQEPPRNPAASAAESGSSVDLAAARGDSSMDDAATAATDVKVAAVDEGAKPGAMANSDNRINPDTRIASARTTTETNPADARKADESHQIDRGRFVQRVARAFSALGKHDGSVRLRLSPPELGSLRLEISVRNGQMTARVEAETATARNLLLDNLPALRDRLAQQDIKVRQFDIQLMDQSPGGLPDRTADHTASQHHGGHHAPRKHEEPTTETVSATTTGPRSRPGEESQLNVVI